MKDRLRFAFLISPLVALVAWICIRLGLDSGWQYGIGLFAFIIVVNLWFANAISL